MSVAIIGDTHFSRKAENPLLKKHIKRGQKEFFEFLVKDLKKRKIKTVFFTGDVFDTRNSINVEALIETKRMFENLMSDFEIHIVCGNHDMYFDDTREITSIELLEWMPNITVHRDQVNCIPINGKDMYIIPWVLPSERTDFISFLSAIEPKKNNNILFGHFDMVGIDMEGGSMSTSGLSPNVFANAASLTISGHYHGHSSQVIDGSVINYVGSPYPLTFANAKSEHGYWILHETGSMEFIKNELSPTFKTIIDTDDLTSITSLENSFVRLYVNNAKTKEEVFYAKSIIESKKPIFLNIIPYKEEGDILINNGIPTDINKSANKLLNMDTFSLSEIYIDTNPDQLPKLTTHADAKLAVLNKVKEYQIQLNLKK